MAVSILSHFDTANKEFLDNYSMIHDYKAPLRFRFMFKTEKAKTTGLKHLVRIIIFHHPLVVANGEFQNNKYLFSSNFII